MSALLAEAFGRVGGLFICTKFPLVFSLPEFSSSGFGFLRRLAGWLLFLTLP